MSRIVCVGVNTGERLSPACAEREKEEGRRVHARKKERRFGGRKEDSEDRKNAVRLSRVCSYNRLLI